MSTSSLGSGCEILDLTSLHLMGGGTGIVGECGVGVHRMQHVWGGAEGILVSVEVVTSNSPGRHLKLLPGSFSLFKVISMFPSIFLFLFLPSDIFKFFNVQNPNTF